MEPIPERDLLITALAVQLGLIGLDEAQEALHDPSDGSIEDRLVTSGRLSTPQGELLRALFDAHCSAFGGDLEQSLESLRATDAAQALAGEGREREQATVSFDASTRPSSKKVAVSIDDASEPLPASPSYRKIRLHAAGGLGQVLLAKDEAIDREVALKQLLEHHSDNPAKRERFLLEGRVTGVLEHPNIVPVYALGTDTLGDPYYVMRFVKGRSLQREIRRFRDEHDEGSRFGRNSLAFRRLLDHLIDVCNALEYAHRRGVIHRDVKPANVMLGSHGETYLVDWGLARVADSPLDDQSFSDEMLERRRLTSIEATSMGSIVGTPGYMSPEQACGDVDELGPQADVYSIGATFYYLLTGEAPITLGDGSITEFLEQVRSGAITPPRQACPDVPRELEAVCLKALATDKRERYRSAAAVAEELERWMADEPVLACPESRLDQLSRWGRKNRKPVTLGVLVLLAGTVASLLAAQAFNRLRTRAENLAAANADLAEAEAAARQKADERFLQAREKVDRWLTGYSDALRHYPGMQAARLRLLTEAAAEYERFADEQTDDPVLRLEQAHTLARLGSVQRAMGDPESAAASYRRAISVYEELADTATGGTSLDSTRAKSLLAMAVADQGDFKAADELLAENIDNLVSLQKEQPEDTEVASTLASSHLNRATVLLYNSQPEQALEESQLAVADCTVLVRMQPNATSHSRCLAAAEVSVGRCLLALGRSQQAVKEFSDAVAVLSALSKLNPADVRLREKLAATLINQSASHRRLGQLAEEATSYRQAIEVYERLARDQPEVPSYREGLAMARTDLGQTLVEMGSLQKAESELAASAALFKVLAEDTPAVTRYTEAYAVALDNLADALVRSGRAAEALELATAAEGLMARLSLQWPGVEEYRRRQAVMMGRRAHARAATGDSDGAASDFQAADRMATALQDSPSAESLLAAATLKTRRAELAWSQGGSQAAGELFQDAAVLWRDLVSSTEDPVLIDAAAWFLATCPSPGARSHETAAELSKKAVEVAPGNERFQITQAVANAEEDGSIDVNVEPQSATMQARLLIARAWLKADAGSPEEAAKTLAEGNAVRSETAPGDWQLAVLAALARQQLADDAGNQPLFRATKKRP